MSLQIGRITLNSPMAVHQSGDSFRFDGFITGSDINAIKALRQGLIGYASSVDEAVVPVVASYDSHIDGFYRVRAGDVQISEGGHALKRYGWSADLERVSDYAAPFVESTLLAPAVRENDHGLTDGIDWHAVPRSAWVDGTYVLGRESGVVNLEADPSRVRVAFRSTPAEFAADLEDATVFYSLTPDEWYVGAPLLEVDYDGSGSYYSVVGRQVVDLAETGGRWRLGNGVVRLTQETQTEGPGGALGLARWLGSEYSTTKLFALGSERTLPGGGVTGTHHSNTVTVLQNTLQTVTLRFYAKPNNLAGRFYDLTLRRGAPWLEVRFGATWEPSGHNAYGIGLSTSETSENLDDPTEFPGLEDVGIKATSADSDGLFYFIACAQANDQDISASGVHLSSPQLSASFVFGLAAEDDNGTGYPTADSAGWSVLCWMKAMSETVRVVER